MKEDSVNGGSAVMIVCNELSGCENVVEFVRLLWKVETCTVIKRAAPEKFFIKAGDEDSLTGIPLQIDDALRNHLIKGVALVSHCGCKMNMVPYDDQRAMLRQSVDYLTTHYAEMKVVGIWIDQDGRPLKIEF